MLYSRIVIFILYIIYSIEEAVCQIDKLRVSCEKYLICRHELEKKYWQCSSKARTVSQYTCKSENLLREFYDDIIHREKYLYRCYSKENYYFHQQKECQLTQAWLSSDSCTAESFSNHQLTCRKLKECCPHVNRCFHKEYFKLLTIKLKEKRENTLKTLYKCTSGLSKAISANISSEDTQIAVDVMKLNELVVATVADMGFLKKKKLSNKSKADNEKARSFQQDSKMKVHGISLLSGNSYVHELNNGTALLRRLASDSVGTKEQTNKEIPRSYRHRSQMITNYPSEPDRNINYNNQNGLNGQSRKHEQLSIAAIRNHPFTIRRPWSSDRKVATKRKIGHARMMKAVRTPLLSTLPVKSKHELKIQPLERVQDTTILDHQKPSLSVEHRYEEQVLEPSKHYNGVERQILNVLSTTERLPPTSTVYSEESEEDFESSLQKKSSSLVQFARNAIPLPIRNSVNSGGTGPNDSDNEMEVVVDGGTWTMIPKVSTTYSPTRGSPLENFVEHERMTAADISDISTQLPIMIENDKLTRVLVQPRMEVLSKHTKKLPELEVAGNFWSRSKHHRVFGTRLHTKENVPNYDNLIQILRNPQSNAHCELAKTCHKLYSIEKANCAASSEDRSLPGVPKRLRFSKCVSVLTPQYEELKNMTRTLDLAMEHCLSLTEGITVGVCSSDVPILPNFNNLLECSNRILFLNLHCEKLSSCCSSTSKCHKIINNSKAYIDMRSKKQDLFQKSQKCQLKSLHKMNLQPTKVKQ